ncbi:PREDICTED: probable methyltransferase PMT27 [Ipomoea nil]|uniref:probable methyltransferase PMT27 n=1 Tax=Ipomoea nil TaxID=35883 RepID=UPI000900B429|nr:PREDICTED: probable methyltransferase PMT27 [Ipomoea nil]
MALGKVRGGVGRRASTTSYSSTITPIAFVALCLFGVWILSSSSSSASTAVVPPKTTARATASSGGASSTATDPNKEASSFEDHPGDLPDDAIKATDRDSDDVKDLETENDDRRNKEAAAAAAADQETGDLESSSIKKPEIEDVVAVVEEKQSGRAKGDGAEESEQEKRQKEVETQTAAVEESSIAAQNTESDQTTTPNDTQQPETDEIKVHDPQTDSQDTLDPTKNMISDEDQQKRLEQQQQQEDDQVQPKRHPEHESQGITSEDQIQHDEATVSGDEDTLKTHPSFSSSSSTDSNQEKAQIDSVPARKTSPQIPSESKDSKKAWSTQAVQSVSQKERTKTTDEQENNIIPSPNWQLCNVTAGQDYIPCLDNEPALHKLRTRRHFEHRERHCPEEPPTCLVQLPKGYKRPIEWPKSREKIWYHNVPNTLLAEVKGHQNWVKVSGEFLVFPGGGTQFIHGALHYIDFLQQAVPNIAWGKHTRVVLDVGCGVASFGGYLFDRDVLAMSFAPKDEHEAQIQFALERGIPAISAVMGTQRLPFPSGVFDVVHCARCRVPWQIQGGKLLLELNRVLRPGGYFIWSATPVYQKLPEDVKIWKAMSALTVSMCWELVAIKKDKLNSIGAAIYHKPVSNDCYNQRKSKKPPMCKKNDDPNAAWYVPLQSCMHRVQTDETQRGSKWPKEWPERLQTPPYWLNRSQVGIYGKPAPEDFAADYEHWKHVVSRSYMSGLGINWSTVRNIMDMRAVYGGFAAALKDLKVWVMNVVNIDSPDTLPIIYERGLFGMYHDWCESFSTYPRSYDLLHADHLFSRLKTRCKITAVVAEVDRIVRPGGKLIVQDDSGTIREVEELLKSLHWEVRMTFYQKQDGMLSAQKTEWRPETYTAST